MRDAEERRRELEVAATHDGLTGLLNRNAAIETIERDLAIASRTGAQVAVLFVDLDGLKQLNDQQGHATGDEGLRLVADALRETTRASDTVARLGGDEFLVATIHGNEASAQALAERIRRAVTNQRVVGPAGPTPLRCSIGIALSDPTITSADLLIHRADSALYVAKGQGGNRVAWHDPLAEQGAERDTERDTERDSDSSDLAARPRAALAAR
jgi:diguanylate cyclase (GGDEF)-like protein